jgi:ring-1,2-phenylacetyl-CoA epoxidase subunit PaaD
MKRHDGNDYADTPSQALEQAVACPFCGSADVELLALFGSQLLTDQYYCRACRTPFEHLRADVDDVAQRAGSADAADAARREE